MPAVTWWGHSTCTIDDRGVRVLTDPLFCSRLGHLRRRRGPVPDDRSRHADLAVVSHLHADHLHLGSLAALPRHLPVAVPSGALRAVPGLRRLRDRELVEVAPGDAVRVRDVLVEVVPAEHDGRRWAGSRRRAPALGYVVCGAARTYFAGDTDSSAEVREAVGRCDVALLPVGGWGPTLGPGHLDPERAAGFLGELDAHHAVPVHFGTMWPIGLGLVRRGRFYCPGAEFAAHAARLGLACSVRELRPGETARLDLADRAPR
jgi:L-ascorbate metabolism protein UlaG (beta-lactamase superfamily)